MKTSVAPLEGNKVKVSVEVDETEFEQAVDAAFRRLAREVRIPGFRPGKAPRRVLEARFGADVARADAIQNSVPEYYTRAVIDNEVDVIAPPEIELTGGQEEGPLAFDAVVEVRPSIEVRGYGQLRVQIPAPAPTDAEIDERIDMIRSQHSRLEVVERPVEEGDQVLIDVEGFQGDELLEGLTTTDYLYSVGMGAVVPELDENLIGSVAGDHLEFDAPHPDDDEGDLSFVIDVKEVRERVLPDATDEWVSENTEFASLDDLRADLRTRLGQVKKMQANLALRERAAEALAALVDDDVVPEALLTSEMQARLQDLAMRLQAQGMTLEQYVAMSGQDPQAFSDELRKQAIVSAKVDLALRSVAEQEELEVTEEGLEDELGRLGERVGADAATVRERLERNEQLSAVRSDLRKGKALDWLIERAEVVDESGGSVDRADLEFSDEAETSVEASTDESVDAAEAEEQA